MHQKRALFSGLFASDSDEIDFAALGQPAFVESVREIVGDEAAAPAPDSGAARAKLAVAAVQLSKLNDIVDHMRGSNRRIRDKIQNTPGLKLRRLNDPARARPPGLNARKVARGGEELEDVGARPRKPHAALQDVVRHDGRLS